MISASSSADRPSPKEKSGCSTRSPSGVSSWTSSGPPSRCWLGPKTSARSGPKPACVTYDSSLVTGCRGVSADRAAVCAARVAQLVTGTTPAPPKLPGRCGRERIRLGGPSNRRGWVVGSASRLSDWAHARDPASTIQVAAAFPAPTARRTSRSSAWRASLLRRPHRRLPASRRPAAGAAGAGQLGGPGAAAVLAGLRRPDRRGVTGRLRRRATALDLTSAARRRTPVRGASPATPALTRGPAGRRRQDIWAPDIQRAPGGWLMYFAAGIAGADENSRCIGVAHATAAFGPFTPVGNAPLVCPVVAGRAPRGRHPADPGRGERVPVRGVIDPSSFIATRASGTSSTGPRVSRRRSGW